MNPIHGLSGRHGNRLIDQLCALEEVASSSSGAPVVSSGLPIASSGQATVSTGSSASLSAQLLGPDFGADWDTSSVGYESDEDYDVEEFMRVVRDEDLVDVQEEEDDLDLNAETTGPEPPHILRLRKWAMVCNVPKRHLSMLLKVLNVSHGNYPLDARTLLRTPRHPTKPVAMSPGSYYHYGLRTGLLSYPAQVLLDLHYLQIDISTDGFVFSNSSKRCGWPIFASVVGSKLDPILVGLYVGRTRKPDSIDEFMKYFVEELREMDGKIELPCGLNEVVIMDFEIRLFVLDTPARAFVVSSRHHNHRFSCHRCHQHAENRQMQANKGPGRTDDTFRERVHKEHHSIEHKTKHSILETHGFNMVTQFPIDTMHLMDLGIGKLILSALIEKKCILDLIQILLLLMESRIIMPIMESSLPANFPALPEH